MVKDDATRIVLKTELLQRVEALGLQQALFPSNGEPIDEIVRQLESINPIPQPLNPDHLPSLLGNWQLVYASKGTVVTPPACINSRFWGSNKHQMGVAKVGGRRYWQDLCL
jgi:hypothetical protein